jgi:hypothetical protein
MMEGIAAIVIIAAVFIAIGLGVAFVVIARRTAQQAVTAGDVLRTYLYLAILTSVAFVAGGGAQAIKGGIGMIEPEFSFRPETVSEVVGAVSEAEGDEFYEAVPQEEQFVVEPDKPISTLLQGILSALIAGALWLVHVLVLRRIAGPDEAGSLLRRGFVGLGLIVFGVTVIASFPAAITQIVDYAYASDTTTLWGVSRPGGVMGVAIAFSPVWLWFLREGLRIAKRV